MAFDARGQKLSLPHGDRVVKHFTGKAASVELRAQEDGTTLPVIRVPISSTTQDRDGDNFSEKGLTSMQDQLKSGKVPFFLDHGRSPGDWSPSYNVLDMQGKWVDGDIDGDVLYGSAELDGGDWRAQELVRKIQAGLPIGYSVGFMVRRADPVLNDEGEATGGLIFHEVDLFEVSAVGIPSNPDGVANAVQALAKSMGITEPALRQRLGIEEVKDMELTPKEQAQIEAQRKAKLDGEPVKALEQETPADAPEILSEEQVRGMIAAEVKEASEDIVASVLEGLKSKMDDEDEEEDDDEMKEDGEDDKEDEEDKAAPSGRQKLSPRTITTATGANAGADTKASQSTAPEGPVPFGFAQ